MKFQCPGCQAGFSVADEKIPEGKGVRILCPRCKMPVEVKEVVPTLEMQSRGDEPSASSKLELDHVQEEMSLLDMVDEDAKTSLLCVSDVARAEKIRSVVSQMGFYVVVASKSSYAIKKFQNNTYHLIILDELFDCAKPSENLFLHHMQLLPMHVRRKFFLCLLSDNLPAMDQMLAFRIGVDLIFSYQELDKIKILVTRAMKDHEGLYKVYSNELGKKGQN